MDSIRQENYGVRCDGRDCQAEIRGPGVQGSDHYDRKAIQSGWAIWVGRSRRHYCPVHEPAPGHKMRQLTTNNLHLPEVEAVTDDLPEVEAVPTAQQPASWNELMGHKATGTSFRWSVARFLDRLIWPRQCWADLAVWALEWNKGEPGNRLPWKPIKFACEKDLAERGACYCGKLRSGRYGC